MVKKEHIDTVESLIGAIINSNNKIFNTTKDRMIYERGLLTGLLAQLASEDSHVYIRLKQIIKQKKHGDVA